MVIKKNKLSSPLFSEPAKKKKLTLHKKPTFSFVIFAIIIALMPLLADAGVIGKSVVTAIGDTIIYCIVALGFCLLLGYSALASLGTAGFIAIGAYSAYYGIVEWKLGIGIAFAEAEYLLESLWSFSSLFILLPPFPSENSIYLCILRFPL